MTAEENTQLALLFQEVRTLRESVDRNNELQQKALDDQDTRLRSVEAAIISLKERLTLWQAGQAVYATAVGVLVAVFKKA